MNQEKLKIVAYSDYICPFCYIGYHRIESLREKYNLDIEWRPFEIHPETPKTGIRLEDFPFPKGYMEMVMANVQRLADEDGLKLNFSGKMPNSRLALSIAEYMRDKGKLDEFHKLVLNAYWIEGKDIGDQSFLLDLAETLGFDREEIKSYIQSDEPINRFKQALSDLRACGINGVPTFIIGDRIVVGAQPIAILEKVINKAKDDN